MFTVSLFSLFNNITHTRIYIYIYIYYPGFGFSTLTTQLLTAPPAIVAGVMIIICGVLADKGNKRAAMVTTGSAIIALGFLMLLTVDSPWGNYINISSQT